MLLDVPMLPHWGEDRTFFMPSRWGGSVFPDAADAVPQLGQCIFWEIAAFSSSAYETQPSDAPYALPTDMACFSACSASS